MQPDIVQAQATVKPDGQMRYALGAGASYSSGNTSAASVNLNGEAVQASEDSKLTLGGKALWSRSEGQTTAENVSLSGAYNQDFTPDWFGFGSADFLRDEFANIQARGSLHGGVGRHLIKRDDLTWDATLGIGYSQDRYFDPVVVNDELRVRYGRAELVLGEESSHKFTETTSFRQKVSYYPALNSGGGSRATLDAGLAVAMTARLSLTAGLNYRYDSDPGVGLKKGDTLFVTGISVKLD
ncbi:MAG TPA: DUF481 domain-containing protein [Ideonella sp.]|uniref:DUF481 domain-containing protein n=1 Tax=Ideonella sp. TaxID=1929293 RepID=UPI002CE6AC5C|nr:DUF481 domain-containing protein [Ideonella sp.]HSI47989.1 DUF481 domain-containing protein [Ideonella sp.]